MKYGGAFYAHLSLDTKTFGTLDYFWEINCKCQKGKPSLDGTISNTMPKSFENLYEKRWLIKDVKASVGFRTVNLDDPESYP
jgi:hypothetical protein